MAKRKKLFFTTILIVLSIIGLPLIPVRAVALDPSVVFYFNFDEGQGNKAIDSSENGNDGEIVGAQWVDGKYGKALEFQGEFNSYVKITANPSLDITDAITMMAWVYKTEFLVPDNNGETIISKKQSGGYCLEISGWENAVPEKVDTEMRISGTYHRVSSPDPLPLNIWVHVAATYDGSDVRLYVDGKEVTKETWPGKIDVNTANLFVGAESNGADQDASHGSFKGIIDEVLLANRAFSEEEINTFMMGPAAVEPAAKLATSWGKLKSAH